MRDEPGGGANTEGIDDRESGNWMLVIGKVVDDAGGAVATVDAVVEERLAHIVEPYPGIP